MKKVVFWMKCIGYFIKSKLVLTSTTIAILLLTLVLTTIDRELLSRILKSIPLVDIPYFDFTYNGIVTTLKTFSMSVMFLYINLLLSSIYKNFKRLDEYKKTLDECIHALYSYFGRYQNIKYQELNKEIQENKFKLYCKIASNSTNNHDYQYLEGSSHLVEVGGIITIQTQNAHYDLIPNQFVEYKHLKKSLEDIKNKLDKLSFFSLNHELTYHSEILTTKLNRYIDGFIKVGENSFMLNPNLVMVDLQDQNFYYIKSFSLPNMEMYRMFQLTRTEFLKVPINPFDKNNTFLGLHKMLNK